MEGRAVWNMVILSALKVKNKKGLHRNPCMFVDSVYRSTKPDGMFYID
jgi:hypothetical protein